MIARHGRYRGGEAERGLVLVEDTAWLVSVSKSLPEGWLDAPLWGLVE